VAARDRRSHPFIECHDEDRLVEIAIVSQGVVGVGDEALAETDVALRVIVTGRPGALGERTSAEVRSRSDT
jgi:hypothetical protein